MKKKLFFLIGLIFTMLICGCGNKEETAPFQVFYMNADKSGVVGVAYEPVATETETLIPELLKVLSSDSEKLEYRKPISNDVEVTKYALDGAFLSIYFDADYSKLSKVEEVLCRAAVVKTLTQIQGVDCVSFYVEDMPLVDSAGNIVGSMTGDSFVLNPGQQINAIQNTELTLYFSNKDGDGLVKEVRNVHYSSNVAIEKLIMEQLLSGPEISGAKAALPSGTKLINISVVDSVCYVSLDETFKNQDYSVNEAIVIYSIVDSLSELNTISKVQISVNGDTSGVYRDTFALNEMYTRNLDYITTNVEEETESVINTETTENTEIEDGTESTETEAEE